MAASGVTKIAIIGTGPAALMAASVVTGRGAQVTLYEKNKGPGRKLLIAGGSGLNITNALPPAGFAAQYRGEGIDWHSLLRTFSPAHWLAFINNLGLETFEGTSGRFFVREMKASGLLRFWLSDLEKGGAQFHYNCEWIGIRRAGQTGYILFFADGTEQAVDAVILALGGASWLPTGEKLQWPQILSENGIRITSFLPANCGFEISWKPEFLAEAVNQPLKNVTLTSVSGTKKGDILITAYGIEGTPVYTVGHTGRCYIDLKPDLSETQIQQKLDGVKENLSPLRRAKRVLSLSPAALALLHHHAPAESMQNTEQLTRLIKAFPLDLESPRPLAEAISSAGGVALDEITDTFEFKKLPAVYAVGEMLNWSAPTGGFLIQACVAQGFVAGQAALAKLKV